MRLIIKILKTLLILFIITLTGCGVTDHDIHVKIPMDEAQGQDNEVIALDELALNIVHLLKEYDLTALSELVHPEYGVRFSPYSYVDSEIHLVFLQSQLPALAHDATVYHWGYYDGTGDPIELTFAEYYQRFIYDQDYVNAESIQVNDRQGQGNSLDNSAEIYPSGTVVEFHFSGFEAQYEGMDWRSLRLVLEQNNNQWYLIAIIHDEWTI